MYWLDSISVRDHFCAPDFDVDLSSTDPETPQHLVLTGPNGSGKTTILQGIAHAQRRVILSRRADYPLHGVSVTWSNSSGTSVERAWRHHEFILAALFSDRQIGVTQPTGPTPIRERLAQPEERLSTGFHQFLVNQQVQARLAKDDEPEASAAIFAWFKTLERSLADLFGLPSLHLRFDRKTYSITFVEEDGRTYTFDHLPSGYASAIHLLAELLMRIHTLESQQPSGVVLIDEIDAFLHPALQERIMPFLTSMFPRIQFIIATHSPAVATSMKNATVVALGSGEVFDAEDLVGTPYGLLMTTLFGISTDVDLATTAELAELKALDTKTNRTFDEQRRYKLLARKLQRTNNPLALDVFTRLLMSER